MATKSNTSAQSAQVNAPKAGASVNAAKAAASGAKSNTSATYVERMCINRDALVKNLSKLWKDCTTGTLIPRELTGLQKSDFSQFREYMCKRHDVQVGEQPRKGWSTWYALQFCEKAVKQAANDPNSPAHAKAVAYLRKSRAAMQKSAEKLY